MTIEKIIENIQLENLGELKLNENMSGYTSIRSGGIVKAVFFPNSVENLIKVINYCEEFNVLYKILGRGSNIIFPDSKLNIIVIKLTEFFSGLTVKENGEVIVEAGYSLQKLSKQLAKQGYSGLEFAGGIPATVGGAVYMNAGAHTQEMSEIVKEVVFLDENLEVKTYENKQCQFSYRNSIFHENNWIILEVKLKMNISDKVATFKKMSGNLEYRKEMQPLEWPSFGSVFKNPDNGHAGQLIEEVGLKGFQIGGAKISDKHANFIVNEGGATAKDIKKLIEYVQKKVYNEKGIKLIAEVELFLDGIDE